MASLRRVKTSRDSVVEVLAYLLRDAVAMNPNTKGANAMSEQSTIVAEATPAEGVVTDIHHHKDANGNDVVAQGKAVDCQQCNPKDEFGRDAAERTVELASKDAEAINKEVGDGKWQSYDDAMHYVIERGLAEIKRTRDAALKLYEQRTLKAKRDNWSKLLQSNPKLLQNADLIQTMLKELGVTQK